MSPTTGGRVQSIETKLEITVDRRAPYKLADRRLQVEAAMKAHALFEEMSALSDRVEKTAGDAEARAAALPAGDALAGKLRAARGKLEEARKKIVATGACAETATTPERRRAGGERRGGGCRCSRSCGS